ncbi:hypothetical protein L5F33_10710 [Aliarcobacter butzleri]|uniref:TPR end-of-group domain-containing protein n=1 Tax=Aliarcobacter butzleri TaxID=28197 RepID=UPI001EDFA34D|nr:hypothetical protein [Aliarcobacter butzleri]MCG3670737.1 hypothetical protein [Aliarcobacter butzleri]
MLELNTKLQLEQPEISEKPFSYLKNCLDNIVDIQDKEHFKGIKERLEIIKIQVDKSIDTYENKDKENNLIKEIIDLRLKENFDEKRINELYQESQKLKSQKLKNSLSELYNDWGNTLSDLGKIKNDEDFFNQAFEKYSIASILNSKDGYIFSNWGVTLYTLAKVKNDDKNLYNQALEKLNKAIELGTSSYNLACFYSIRRNKKEALELLEEVLNNNEIEASYVQKDEDWDNFKEDEDFKKLIEKYR